MKNLVKLVIVLAVLVSGVQWVCSGIDKAESSVQDYRINLEKAGE